jgi:hypothetical protein
MAMGNANMWSIFSGTGGMEPPGLDGKRLIVYVKKNGSE